MGVNWKGPESGQSWSFLRQCPNVCLEKPRKTMENSSGEPITQQSEINLTFLLSVWMKIRCGFKHCENTNEKTFFISSLYDKKVSFTKNKKKDLYIREQRNKEIRRYVLKSGHKPLIQRVKLHIQSLKSNSVCQYNTNFPKIQEPLQNFKSQNSDMKQFPYWKPT